MSLEAPETQEEYEAKREELIGEAKETKEELDRKQNEALEAIKEGGELEKFETVTLGELEMEVKAWLPGNVQSTVEKAKKLGDSEDLSKINESMETMLSALAEMTTSDIYDMGFWRQYHDEYGPTGLILAIETILGPAMDEMEKQKEGVDTFRQK